MQSGDKKTIERVYNYICNYISQNQISPSVRDICAGVGLKSTSSVHTSGSFRLFKRYRS